MLSLKPTLPRLAAALLIVAETFDVATELMELNETESNPTKSDLMTNSSFADLLLVSATTVNDIAVSIMTAANKAEINFLPLLNLNITVMVNLLGESDGPAKLKGLEKAYLVPKAHLHFYGKGESKTGRKMGHFTVVDPNLDVAIIRANELKKFVRVVGV